MCTNRPGSGHYTSYAWNPTASQWFNLNDAKVTTSNGDVIAQEIVYMLFYKRRRIRAATARQIELLSLTTPVSTPSSSVASSPESSPESPSVSVSGLTPPLSGEGGEGDEGDTGEPREIDRAKRGRNDIIATTPNHTDEDEEAAEGSSENGVGERDMESIRETVKRGRGRGRGRGRPRTKV